MNTLKRPLSPSAESPGSSDSKSRRQEPSSSPSRAAAEFDATMLRVLRVIKSGGKVIAAVIDVPAEVFSRLTKDIPATLIPNKMKMMGIKVCRGGEFRPGAHYPAFTRYPPAFTATHHTNRHSRSPRAAA